MKKELNVHETAGYIDGTYISDIQITYFSEVDDTIPMITDIILELEKPLEITGEKIVEANIEETIVLEKDNTYVETEIEFTTPFSNKKIKIKGQNPIDLEKTDEKYNFDN